MLAVVDAGRSFANNEVSSLVLNMADTNFAALVRLRKHGKK